jgi:hypothetical protein
MLGMPEPLGSTGLLTRDPHVHAQQYAPDQRWRMKILADERAFREDEQIRQYGATVVQGGLAPDTAYYRLELGWATTATATTVSANELFDPELDPPFYWHLEVRRAE